jgi:hypothetical protein
MCSLSLYTKTKDIRDLLCNVAHSWDKKYNIPFTEEDNKQKCIIFGIPTSKTDFITGAPVKTGDHWYPIGGLRSKENKIGSDSEWNIIPVSGSNKKENKYNQIKRDMLHKKDIECVYKEYSYKIEQWIGYVESRGAKFSYDLPEEFNQEIENRNNKMMLIQDECFHTLCNITPVENI